MLRVLHLNPQSRSVVEIDPSELPSIRRADGWVWVDGVGVDGAEVEAICERFGFDWLGVEDVLAEVEHPKTDAYGDHTFVVIHGLADDTARLRTVEHDLFIGPDYLVAFRSEELSSVAWLRGQVADPGTPVPESPDRLFALLAEAGASGFAVLVDALDARFDDLEERALAGDPGIVGEVHALRRDVLRLIRVLVPQQNAMRRLGREVLPAIGDRARMRLHSAQDQYDRAVQSLDAWGDLLGAILETYRAGVAERTNEVMKVLTVFAAIMMPLSLIAGVYGMNFVNMPELEWRWAYVATLGFMAVVGMSLWVYFARRGFIGGPRFSRVPRAVGTGLAGLVRITTRPATAVGRMLANQYRSGPD